MSNFVYKTRNIYGEICLDSGSYVYETKIIYDESSI